MVALQCLTKFILNRRNKIENKEKDAEIAKLQAQIDELNSIIAEKDEEIGKLKAELEKSDSKPAEEQLKSQKTVKPIWKPRF